MAFPLPPLLDLGIAITSNQTSHEMRAPDMRDALVNVMVKGTGTFTVDIEASLDGLFWSSIATKTASEYFGIDSAPLYRAVYTGLAGANVTVYIVFTPNPNPSSPL